MISGGPLRQVLLRTVVTDETTSAPVDCSSWPYLSVYITGAGTLSSGVITIEEADFLPEIAGTDLGYSGTWSSMGTVNATAATGGAQTVVHFAAASYRFVRARISTEIGGGGTITVVLTGI